MQVKQPADDLVASKKELDEEQVKLKQKSRDAEENMRVKASTVGNIVAKDVPVSLTEVCILFLNVSKKPFSYKPLGRQ
jgi:seryl-tRNA synthetase